MTTPVAPKIADEIEALLIAAFTPTRLAVINDSAKHSGHSGDDGSGASHFTVEIESAAFAGVSRLQRQRLVQEVSAVRQHGGPRYALLAAQLRRELDQPAP